MSSSVAVRGGIWSGLSPHAYIFALFSLSDSNIEKIPLNVKCECGMALDLGASMAHHALRVHELG